MVIFFIKNPLIPIICTVSPTITQRHRESKNKVAEARNAEYTNEKKLKNTRTNGFIRRVLRPGEEVIQEGRTGVVHVLRDLGQQVLPALLDVAPDFLGLLPFDTDLQLPALKSKSRNLESIPTLSANLQS